MNEPPMTNRNKFAVMKQKPMTYLSLFSAAGIGCYGFKQEGFNCVATVEIMEKRLMFQRYNEKCAYKSGYISNDITDEETKEQIRTELARWDIRNGGQELDVLISTPPCQGMSVANHKKGNELLRNSLVVESIKWVKEIKPRFFIFENVRSFLKTTCTDIDGKDRTIGDAIELNLAGHYHIHFAILNFKDYGCPSSRTRTVVIGTRKDLKEVTPFDILPSMQKERTLEQTIGHLPRLATMGGIWTKDIYHNFKKYNPEMVRWIEDLTEGQSAFDNKDKSKIPHKKVGTLRIVNTNKNGDKYRRQFWNKVAPCIHTRNDILSSQNTVHPVDNRVFSIREVMLLMSVPASFQWSDIPFEKLNALTLAEKKKFLSKNEMTIRHSLGEAVPTVIFQQIAKKIKAYLTDGSRDYSAIKKIIQENSITENDSLNKFIESNIKVLPHPVLAKIAELSNTLRGENAAYYTRQDICYSIMTDLPEPKRGQTFRILEPSIGVGNFLPLLIERYKNADRVIIDVVDIDANSLKTLSILLRGITVPPNFQINQINADFLLYDFKVKYDLVIGNPPFMKLKGGSEALIKYREKIVNRETNNIFAFFIEKALQLGDTVALIVPKSLVNAPEFNKTREILEAKKVIKITDYGEEAFKGVKIETISFIVSNQPCPTGHEIKLESYITDEVCLKKPSYIFSKLYPYWLLYRNEFFDTVARKLKFDIFKAYRDRQITKQITLPKGKIRVLKSRNIANNEIINLTNYDCFVNNLEHLDVGKFINHEHAILVPNLTYNPRACFLPKGTITDGSVAILTLKNGSRKVTKDDLEYYCSEEYEKFYAIARNHGTRSLNIDNNSVFFFGILKDYPTK